MKGTYTIIDGMDGAGKGVFLDALVHGAQSLGARIFDMHTFWETNNRLPKLKELDNYDVIVTSEPTFYGLGKKIRTHMIAKENKGKYSASQLAASYALDRMVQLNEIIIPARNAGKHIFSSRSVVSSIVYQTMMAQDEGDNYTRDDILELEGNQIALGEGAPDYAIIPLLADVDEALRRLKGRDKDDDTFFEEHETLTKIRDGYSDPILNKILVNAGIQVQNIDSGISLEYSKQEAQKFFDRFIAPRF